MSDTYAYVLTFMAGGFCGIAIMALVSIARLGEDDEEHGNG